MKRKKWQEKQKKVLNISIRVHAAAPVPSPRPIPPASSVYIKFTLFSSQLAPLIHYFMAGASQSEVFNLH
jgi:hypothetical protein